MRFEFILITIVTLAVQATCTPLQTMPNVTRIPLSQPASFIKHDGSFDLHGTMEHIAHIRNKYRQNRINFRRNVGGEVFNDSADIEPFPAVPVGLQRRRDTSNRVSLTKLNRFWTGSIKIGMARGGTPDQVFTVVFDTGSADLWVPSVDCNYIGCEGKKKYNHLNSDTGIPWNSPGVTLKYRGIEVSGTVYFDRVQVGEITIFGQHFLNAYSISDSFKDAPYDGILGMAYPTLSRIKQRPFFNAAIHNWFVTKGIFTFALGNTNPEVCLGGIDRLKYKGDVIEYHKVVPFKGYWQIGGASALVGENVPVKDFITIIDSGSSFILGPPIQVAYFFHVASGASQYGVENGVDLYQYHCNDPPDFNISWDGGIWWSVPAESFSNGKIGGGMCISTVMSVDGLPDNTWVLGTPFMKNVYAVFDFDSNKIGFAPPR